MRVLILISFLLFSLPASATNFGHTDKRLHIGASATITLMGYGLARKARLNRWQSALIAGSLALSVGVAKELSDSRFDSQDMEANFIGVGTGLVLPLTFQF